MNDGVADGLCDGPGDGTRVSEIAVVGSSVAG